ncbi:MAG: hypothetical protein RI945_73 [Candidatus Parcubacteria bacterium]
MKTFSLLENEYKREDFFLVKIDTELVSVLRQTRTEMSHDGIGELCSSIAESGQKTPGDIYAFEASQAELYLKRINELWNMNYDIRNFSQYYIPEKTKSYYLFLVAGHRRLKACINLSLPYLTNIHFDKTFEDAIKWQLEENLHEEVPLPDLINSATGFWVLLKKENPKLTLKEFAKRHVHKSVSWLSNALRFIRLPLGIQELIKKTEIQKGVGYSIMLEFAKLYDFSISKEKPITEEFLMSFINHCISHKYALSKVKEFCEIKREEIEGQQEIFHLVPEDINQGTLRAIKGQRTNHMRQAEDYLKASTVIARQITDNCKRRAAKVIEVGQQMQLILPSE